MILELQQWDQLCKLNGTPTVYVLDLDAINTVYVGSSIHVSKRVMQHNSRTGSIVTQRLGVYRIREIIPCGSVKAAYRAEKNTVVTYARDGFTAYGWNWIREPYRLTVVDECDVLDSQFREMFS